MKIIEKNKKIIQDVLEINCPYCKITSLDLVSSLLLEVGHQKNSSKL